MTSSWKQNIFNRNSFSFIFYFSYEHVITGFMFCWLCIIVYQYSETTVMNFLFSLLRIKGLYIYMFQALLAHTQEVLNKQHLIYCMCFMSVGCTRIGAKVQSWCSQHTYHARNIPSTACVVPPEDKQIMLETCRGP
jgi:uncharacterized membrane protein YbjE (DUF340 family)